MNWILLVIFKVHLQNIQLNFKLKKITEMPALLQITV